MNQKQLKKKLRELKDSMSEYLSRKKEASTNLDIQFRNLFDELNEDHHKLLAMARVAKYEIMMNMLEEEDDDPGTDITGEDEEEESC